jgi:hypothetical protein
MVVSTGHFNVRLRLKPVRRSARASSQVATWGRPVFRTPGGNCSCRAVPSAQKFSAFTHSLRHEKALPPLPMRSSAPSPKRFGGGLCRRLACQSKGWARGCLWSLVRPGLVNKSATISQRGICKRSCDVEPRNARSQSRRVPRTSQASIRRAHCIDARLFVHNSSISRSVAVC